MVAAAVGLALVLVLAACGGESSSQTAADQADVIGLDDTPTSTVPGGESDDPADRAPASPSTTAGAGEEGDLAAAQTAYIAFTECMRDGGLPVPPAAFDAEGRIDITFDPGEAGVVVSEGEFDDLDFDAVTAECESEITEEQMALIAPDLSEAEDFIAEQQGEFEAQMLDMARCMRETHPEFPDPVPFDFDAIETDSPAGGVVEFDPFPGFSLDDPSLAEDFEACAQRVGLAAGP